MIPSDWVDRATRRLDGLIQRTPLTYDPNIDAYIKWENRQKTGSFKIRGALNKILSLEPWEQQRGLVTASAGNHGQGAAVAAGMLSVPLTVFSAQSTPPVKVEAMRALGAEVRLVPGGYEEAERAAQAYAAQTGATWVSPYNDGQVIAGQATLGLEVLDQLADQPPSAILAPVGGGGLIAGIAAAIEPLAARPRLVGVQSEASPFFHHIFYHGTQAGALERESLADGLAGSVEEGSITIPIVRRCVSDLLLVHEDQVAQAIAYAWQQHSEKVEGAGAVTLAAVLSGQGDACRSGAGPLVVIVSGGNIQPEVHARITTQLQENGREGLSG